MKKLLIPAFLSLLLIPIAINAENKTLEFRLVLSENEAKEIPHDIIEYKDNPMGSPQEIIVGKEIFLSNKDIEKLLIIRAKNRYKQYPEEYKTITDEGIKTLKIDHEERKGWYINPEIKVIFTRKGSKKLEEFSRNNKKRHCAIIFDGKILTAPRMMVPLTAGQISIESPRIPNNEVAEDIVKQLGFEPKYIYE